MLGGCEQPNKYQEKGAVDIISLQGKRSCIKFITKYYSLQILYPLRRGVALLLSMLLQHLLQLARELYSAPRVHAGNLRDHRRHTVEINRHAMAKKDQEHSLKATYHIAAGKVCQEAALGIKRAHQRVQIFRRHFIQKDTLVQRRQGTRRLLCRSLGELYTILHGLDGVVQSIRALRLSGGKSTTKSACIRLFTSTTILKFKTKNTT